MGAWRRGVKHNQGSRRDGQWSFWEDMICDYGLQRRIHVSHFFRMTPKEKNSTQAEKKQQEETQAQKDMVCEEEISNNLVH